MLVSDIITSFETYVDDTSELSSVQELALCQKIYDMVWGEGMWEFAKKNATGAFALTTPNIALPADFEQLAENYDYTDNAYSIETNARPRVVFVGSSYSPYPIVNWSDRRQYRNTSGYAYLDLPNNGITFSVAPTSTDTYDFDYKKIADTLATGSTPAFPVRFHPILYHGMAIDNDIILRYPKASSYAPENKAKFDAYLASMKMWNAALQNN